MSTDRLRTLPARIRDGVRSIAARTDPRREPIERLAGTAVTVLAGLVVLGIALVLFPHHSGNHDEAVYLTQAGLFLEGQVSFHAGAIADAVRPWFFVQDGGRLSPKYQPYPAALFAIPMGLFDAPRLALAVTAAANAGLVYLLGTAAFDRRTGVLAAVLFAASPMALLASSVFLPYAPTTTLTLAFAVLYLRARRSGRVRTAALAGGAIGLAFLARPFTAVVFATPFVAHALLEVAHALRAEGPAPHAGGRRPLPGSIRTTLARPAVRRHLATAAVGLAFVAVTLAYNALVTGDPLLFPYAAFGPHDGPGFGHRELLGHVVDYTPAVAAEANARVLWYLATRWGPLGPVGTVLAGIGLAAAARRWPWRRARRSAGDALDTATLAQVLLAGLLGSVALGNLAFWGNHNVLGTFTDPTDGLVSLFGPIYHFDLLAPLAIFGAAGALGIWRAVTARVLAGRSVRQRRATALAVVLVAGLLAGGLTASLLAGPVERNAAYTDRYESAYEPFEDRSIDDAVVLVPTPYGDWLGHPFQSLRNDGGLDGPVVYAMDRHPESDFAVVDAYPDRQLYRYTYRGEWAGYPTDAIEAGLLALDRRSGVALAGETVVSVPGRVSHATVRLETGPEFATYRVEDPADSIAVEWSLSTDGARFAGSRPAGPGDPLAIARTDEVTLQIRLVAEDGSTRTYRQEATVRTDGDRVEVLWPPERTVCSLVDDCGSAGTYLPNDRGGDGGDVRFETRLRRDGA